MAAPHLSPLWCLAARHRRRAGEVTPALIMRGQEIMAKVDEARAADLDAAARARHAAIMQRQGELFYRGATRLSMSPESDGPSMLSSPLSTREVGA